MSIFKRCLFAFACLLLAQVSFAQQLPSSRLYGEVLVNHRPMAGIPVTIRRISDAAGNIDTSRTSTLFRTVVNTDSTGYYYASVEYDTLSRPVLYLVSARDCDSSFVVQGVTVTGQGGYAPRLEICNQTVVLPTHQALAGSVLRGGAPWSNTWVYVQRLTRDDGSIDSSGTLYANNVNTNSYGYYELQVPVSPIGALTLYRVSVMDCDSSTRSEQVLVQGPTYVPAFFLCDSTANCNFSADFGVQTSGLNVFVSGIQGPFNARHLWDFGDGTTDSNLVCAHPYRNPGTYTICHTMTAGACVKVSCQTVTVLDSMGAQFVDVGGVVSAGGQCVTDSVLIEFFGMNQGNNMSVVHADSGCFYLANVHKGRYLIRATPMSHSLLAQGYLPTYYGDGLLWDSTGVVDIQSPTATLNIQLQRADTTLNRSNGRVRVHMAGDGTQFLSPMHGAGAQLFFSASSRVLLYSASGKKIGWAATSQGGSAAEFGNLPAGRYRIYAEMPFMASTSQWVTLTAANNQATANYTATSQGLSPANVTAVGVKVGTAVLEVAPNPAQTTLSLRLPGVAGAGTVRLLAPDGRAVWTGETSNLSETLSVPVYQLAPGIYHALVSQDGRTLAAARVQVVR